MIFYFAPLEGLTTYVYRNAHHKYFSQVDKYFTPFITTNQNFEFSSRDINDILPENNTTVPLVPQILCNKSSEFVHAASFLEAHGYKEVNFNLGCPSGTVVAKQKGSGFLKDLEKLDAFLETIYSQVQIKISIKTRLGIDDSQQFDQLIHLFNKFPVSELIIHPRVQKDFYKNTPRLEAFQMALSTSKAPVCYNGDLFSEHQLQAFTKSYPTVSTLMLGRGLLMNPNLLNQVKTNTPMDFETLRAFHDDILNAYKGILSGEHNVLYKMKALWFYMIDLFPDSSKQAKKIKKCQRLAEYESIINSLWRQ